MAKRHWAIYGSVRMLRVFCKSCGGMTLVVDGKKLCCDKKAEVKTSKLKQMTLGVSRKRPSAIERKRILTIQDNKCLYCNRPFGSPYVRNNKILFTKLCFDHLIPYAYSQSNKNNFVAACHICNGIKSDKMFETVEEVYHYVEYHRKKKGITFINEDLPSV